MNYYTITLTQTIQADSEQEAKDQFELNMQHGIYDADQIEVEQDIELEEAIETLYESEY